MFKKVLVANRGEIAVRIIRTLREMGIVSVAAFSDADRDALFVQLADEAYRLGPAPAGESYLNTAAILDVAARARADAVHPGYGFLAENSPFADAVQAAGMIFIGPSPGAMKLMGDKVRARRAVLALGVPVVPGTESAVTSLEQALAFGQTHGYPVAVKASGGGGGRGIRVVARPEGMDDALNAASREAEAYFKNPEIYLERYYPDPRHIEIQVLGDRHGRLVHLGERDCSVQRRHQKLIEEAPSPVVDRTLRQRMGDVALRAAEAAEYWSAGTVEFLLTREGEYFFLEMNTRIQVEHPVTELVADVDLIREMVLVAAGEPLTVGTSLLDPRGHALEVRVNAEDAAAGFQPTPATIERYREPGGIGVRVDSGVYSGFTIPQTYDSLMSKLIVWAPDRESARRRSLRAMQEYQIEGPKSTLQFARAVVEHPTFVAGAVGTTFVGDHLDELRSALAPDKTWEGRHSSGHPVRVEPRTFEVEVNRKFFQVQVAELKQANPGDTGNSRRRRSNTHVAPRGPDILSPMHGTVLAARKQVGDQVREGETVFVIEAMKMENEVAAHRSGTLAQVAVGIGDTVETGQKLGVIE